MQTECVQESAKTFHAQQNSRKINVKIKIP
jgi:hypothetical protein